MRNLALVDATTAAALAGAAGVCLGAGLTALTLRRRSPTPSEAPSEGRSLLAPAPATVPQSVREILGLLRSAGMILDASDRVIATSNAPLLRNLVRGNNLVHSALRKLVRQTRRSGQLRETQLELALRPDGPVQLYVDVRALPLRDDQVLLLVEDRSEQHRLEQVSRDFVANVSHELKTPVGGIALLAEAIRDAQDDSEAVARFSRRISVEADRLTHLIREIVDLSRLQGARATTSTELVDLDRCARDAVDRAKVIAESRQVELVCAITPQVQLWGDAELVTTAVRNLIGNAITYSDPGLPVAVAVRLRDGQAEVSVSDRGVGIPEDEQDRIFERFYRVDAARSRATGGTGLGLSIVQHIVELHGGEVKVWSQPGHGSTFTLRFPAVDPADLAAYRLDHTVPSPARPDVRPEPDPPVGSDAVPAATPAAPTQPSSLETG